MDAGARERLGVRHATRCSPARRSQRIADSPLQHVVVTDTIPLSEAGQACAKVRVKCVARLLGEAIKRIHHGDSISSLFI